jgi:hypothetical protein
MELCLTFFHDTNFEDDDAKYFRENIRYFNSHFSFTSLGVTLDPRVSIAARTGVYTFQACGGLYHTLDDLVPADNGPRHLQLYIYDTDENLIHRAKRSPDLNIEVIRKILGILGHNPYAQVFKSLGVVPNLDEYRISLNTSNWISEGTMPQRLLRWQRYGLKGATHKIALTEVL